MIRKLLLLYFLSVSIIGLTACEQKSEYEQWVKQELEKNIQRDSLFLGYHFGMTRREFYDHSWKLNRQKLVMQGNNNQFVEYVVKELKHEATMNFYPDFHEEEIYRMPVIYAYEGWAPWNRNLWADSLEQDILELYKEKYGDKFIKMKHPELEVPSYIIIDGNKRIAIYQSNDSRTVAAVFTDLNVFNRLKDE